LLPTLLPRISFNAVKMAALTGTHWN